MKTCFNHLEKQAYSICRNCGKDYCPDCLNEGEEYYYCNEPACKKHLKKDEQTEALPESVFCTRCRDELVLEEDERKSRKVYCPDCEVMIDFNESPPRLLKKAEYVQLFSSLNQVDVGIVKSLLDNADVDYHVYEENFLSVRPLLQPARFMVNMDDAEKALAILNEYEPNIWGTSAKQIE